MEVEFLDAPSRVRFADLPRKAERCDSRVPYDALEKAKATAHKLFPNATRVVALWTPNGQTQTAVEVWHGNRAKVMRVNGVSA